MNNSNIMRNILFILGITVLIYLIKSLDFETIKLAFKELKWYALIIIIGLNLLTIIIKALRWKYLIFRTTRESISYFFSFCSIIAGVAAGSLTPSRAGEVAKPFMLKSKGIEISKTLSSVLTERICDLLSLIFLFFVGLWLLPKTGKGYEIIKIFVAIGAIILGSMIFIFPKYIRRLFERCINNIKSELWKERCLKYNHNFWKGFEIFKDKKVLLVVGFTSLLAMTIEVVRLYFVFYFLGITLNWWVIMFAFAAAVIFGLLTMVPGGIGTTETSLATILTGFSSNLAQNNLIKAAIILDRFLAYYLLIGLGAIVLLINHKLIKKNEVEEIK